MGRIPFNETEEEKLAREREDSIKKKKKNFGH